MVTRDSGRRLRCICVLAWLVCVASVARVGADYRTVDVEGLKITVDTEWGTRTAPGYIPVRFDVTNLGEARVIEILGYSHRFIRSPRMTQPGRMTVRQSVRLARGDRVRLTIPVPIFADMENIGFEIQEEGRTLERFGHMSLQSNIRPDEASTLIVADTTSPYGKLASNWPRTVSPSPGSGVSGRSLPPLDFVRDPSRVPANWIGFTSLRAVFIGPTEWQQLSDEQRTALLTWTACGGDLMFVDGSLDALPALVRKPGWTGAEGQAPPVRAYLLGRIHFPTSESVTADGLGKVLAAASKTQDSNWALPANSGKDWATMAKGGYRLPIPGVGGVPARTYLLILIVFTALVGPANYWFLRRKGQQVLLVLTAPMISAIFILVLAGYVLAGEGIGVRGRAVTFTVLDEARNQAATRASVSLYAAGMSPSGGLRFARDTAIFPLGRDGRGPRDSLNLDLTGTQQFAAGIIQARSPTNFEQVGFTTAREQLTFTRSESGISVMNRLGGTILTLLYRDGDTVYHLVRPLAVGARETLTNGRLTPGTVVPADLPWSGRLLYLVEHQPAGTYLAVLERSPFWDPGLSGISERGSFHVVLGWPGGQP